jgi:outer membrane protein assembly factor BamB
MKQTSIHIWVCSLLALCFLPLRGGAEDWAQWRGPDRDGISKETGLLEAWPEGGPPLLWKAAGLGGGYVTPSVAGGRVYGAGYRGEDEVVWALDVADGKEIWSARVGEANLLIQHEGPRATPTVEGELLFTLGSRGNLVALETRTGKVVWTRDLVSDFGGEMMSRWGYSESPLVDGDHLICAPGGEQGTVVALDKRTGELIWRSEGLKDAASYASLVPAELGGQRQYIVLTGESVAGIGAADGQVLWRAGRVGKTAVCVTPIVQGNRVWVTSSYGAGSHLFEVRFNGGSFSVEEVYASRAIANHHGGAILVGDHVYAAHGPVLVCMELATGRVAWRERSVGEGSLAYADGRLYLRSQNGPVALIEATPGGYVEKGRFNQPDRSDSLSWPHPVIAGGRLYLRDMDLLLCYDITRD